jgi:hypothetical protein
MIFHASVPADDPERVARVQSARPAMIQSPRLPAIAGLLAATLAFAALLTFALPSNAQGQFMPPGSYQQSCKDFIFFKGGGLSALCRRRDGSFGRRTAMEAARRCPWIVNNDGALGCASPRELCEKHCRELEHRRPGENQACLNKCGS